MVRMIDITWATQVQKQTFDRDTSNMELHDTDMNMEGKTSRNGKNPGRFWSSRKIRILLDCRVFSLVAAGNLGSTAFRLCAPTKKSCRQPSPSINHYLKVVRSSNFEPVAYKSVW
jgi:hypothetical protein